MLAIIYVSESQSGILASLKQVISSASTCFLAHSFQDIHYNRTSFFVLGSGEKLRDCVLSVCSDALYHVDYTKHTGTHPTLGSVDHISFSPLGEETLNAAGALATNFAELLATSLGVPAYMYGAASPSGMRLKDLRKQLGYFGEDACVGATAAERLRPNYGCDQIIDPRKGVSTVGAVPLVVNFNMKFRPEDSREKVLKVTKAVRGDCVEALTLPHSDGAFEVACNLLNTRKMSPEDVLKNAEELSLGLGLKVASSYCTGPTEDELLKRMNDYIAGKLN